MAKIESIINKNDRVALYSATVEAVAVETVMAEMKAATIAADIADAIVLAIKADNYRQFVNMFTAYGYHLQTIDEINEWWSFVTAIMTGKADISTGHKCFEFDLQRFAVDEQKAFFERLATENPLETVLKNVYGENVKDTCNILNRMLRDIDHVNTGCDFVYGVHLADINEQLETALETVEEKCKAVLAEMPEDITTLSNEELEVFLRAAKAIDDKDVINSIAAVRENRRARWAGIESYAKFILGATLADFGDDYQLTVEFLLRDYHILRGHRGFDKMSYHDEVKDKLYELYREALEKSWNDILVSLDDGSQLNDSAPRGSKRFIGTQHEVEKLLKRIMKRAGKGMHVTMLNYASDGRVTPSIHTQDYGFAVRELERMGQLETCKMVTGARTIQQVQRFCRAIIMVSVQNAVNLANLYSKVGKFRAIYRTLDPKGFDRFWSCVEVAGRKLLFDICSNAGHPGYGKSLDYHYNEEFFELEQWQKVFAVNGYYVYDGTWATSSPGELKSKVVALPGVYKGGDADRNVDWAAFWHEATSGAWTEFIRRGEKLTFEAIAEFTARITLVNAYAWYCEEYPMDAVAVYAGKIAAKRDTGTIKAGHNFVDGGYWISNTFMANLIEAVDQEVEVSRDALVGVGIQNRTLNIKGYGLVVTDDAIADIMKDICTDEIHFYVYEMTAEQRTAWWNLSLNKFKSNGEATTCEVDGQRVDLAKKMIVFHWTPESCEARKRPQLLCDANAMKVGFEPEDAEAKLKALASSHESGKTQVTSTQLLASFLASNYKKTFLQQDVLTDIMLQESKERLLDEDGERLSYLDFKTTEEVTVDYDTGEETTEIQHPNYAELVDRVAPVLSLEYSFAAWRKRVDRELKRSMKRIERLNIPIEGTHVTIVPDLGMVFGGVKVLGCTKDGITETFSNNPMATSVTKEEYINRYKALATEAGVSEAMQAHFVETVNGLSKGIAAVPADDITARAGEGFDFDGDSMYFLPMHKGYKFEGEHYRWALDGEEPDDFVTFGVAIRYPKTHPDGFMKIRPECWLGQPKCVYIE